MSAQDVQQRAIITLFSGILAIFLNFSLLIIIRVVQSNSIGKYSYLLFLYTLSAFFYSIAQILVVPSFFATPSGYLFHSTIDILPRDLSTIFVFFFSSCYIQNGLILCLSFVYRYCVFKQERLEFLHRNAWKIALGSILIMIYLMGIITYEMKPSLDCDEEFGPRFQTAFNRSVTEIGYLCASIWLRGHLHWGILSALGSFFTFVVITGIIIGFCVSRILKMLEIRKNESETLATNQRRIFILLILQLALPFFFNIFPVQFVLISSYLNLDVEKPSHYLGCFLSLAQVVDPILIIFFIRPYRIAIFKTQVGSSVSSTSQNCINH